MIKVKKFDNIWTMGLILFGAILVFFYIAKLFFPEWIIGVAETPRIVEIGEYIDSHLWAFFVFNIVIGFIYGYIYCGACCRVYKLNCKAIIVLSISIVILLIFSMFIPEHYTAINYLIFYSTPFAICLVNNIASKETYISASICFAVDLLAQILTLEIRDLTTMSTAINSASVFILMIDMLIWRILLYLYFNKKEII